MASNLMPLMLASPDAVNRAISRLRSTDTLAVLTSQDAVSGLDRKRIQAALRRPKGLGISMLVFGVSAREDANELKFWSGGAIRECVPLPNGFRPKVLEVQKSGSLPRMLAGLELPAVVSPTCRMRFEPTTAVQTILAVRGDGGTNPAVLIRVQAETGEVFFVPQMEAVYHARPWE